MRFKLALLASLLVYEGGAAGSPIISVSGPQEDSFVWTLGGNRAVGFSLASTYRDLSITTTLLAFSPGGTWNLTAYLTDQIGPGATAANVITSFSGTITLAGTDPVIPFVLNVQPICANLDLGPGTYYLILSGSPGTTDAYWLASQVGVVTTFDGASLTAGFLTAGSPDPFLPASAFSAGSQEFWFEVSGVAVPEPGSGLLIVAGSLTIVALGRKARALL